MKRQKSTKRKRPIFQIEIIGGNQYSSLEAAQEAALPAFSASLQSVIRDLLDRGILIAVDGKIIPNPNSES